MTLSRAADGRPHRSDATARTARAPVLDAVAPGVTAGGVSAEAVSAGAVSAERPGPLREEGAGPSAIGSCYLSVIVTGALMVTLPAASVARAVSGKVPRIPWVFVVSDHVDSDIFVPLPTLRLPT